MMKHFGRSFLTAAVGCLLAPAGAQGQMVAPRTPEAAISAWPNDSRHLARLLLQKYGQPKTFDSQSLVWENNRPFLKTIVFRAGPWRKEDILQQTLRYRGADTEIAGVLAFDKRVAVDRDDGTLTMTAPDEKTIMLGLNLAHDIAWGVKTPKQARAVFKKTLSLSKSGKSSPYMKSFRFAIEP